VKTGGEGKWACVEAASVPRRPSIPSVSIHYSGQATPLRWLAAPFSSVVLALCLAFAAHPILAQGPKPVGIQQPATVVTSNHAKLAAPPRGDSGHVRPNHWKRGATIGLIIGTVPVAILLADRATDGSNGGDKNYGLVLGTGILILTGFLGWLTGGLIGSFFPQ
jgi:hypothetical protein